MRAIPSVLTCRRVWTARCRGGGGKGASLGLRVQLNVEHTDVARIVQALTSTPQRSHDGVGVRSVVRVGDGLGAAAAVPAAAEVPPRDYLSCNPTLLTLFQRQQSKDDCEMRLSTEWAAPSV